MAAYWKELELQFLNSDLLTSVCVLFVEEFPTLWFRVLNKNVLNPHFYFVEILHFLIYQGFFLNFLAFFSLFLHWNIVCISNSRIYSWDSGFSFFIICNIFILKWGFHIRESENIHTSYIQYKFTFLDKVINKQSVSLCLLPDGLCSNF